MAITLGLKILPPADVHVLGVVDEFPRFRVLFSNSSQCLIDPDPTPGARRLYPFSPEIVERCKWVERYEDVIIVAGLLAFSVVGERRATSDIHTLLCEYRGMRS